MSVGIALAAVSAVSTGAQVAGQIGAAREQEATLEYQADLYRAEAAEAEAEAQAEERATEKELKTFKRQARRFMASQRSRFAASGVQLSGSAENILIESAILAEQDANAIRRSGEIVTSRFRNRARRLENIGDFFDTRASTAKRSGLLTAGITALSGGLTTTEIFLRHKKQKDD